MNNTNIIDVNEIDFEKNVIEASDEKLVVVDFWAPWCGPCKQLTPILEKIISGSPDKILLAKINIDENQQIAAQLRIQSIPAVFAFKDKQVVNAFQGVIPETKVIEFLEKSLGEKLDNNFEHFYSQVKIFFDNKDFSSARELLEDFISKNSKEVKAIGMYIDSLIGLNKIKEANDFLKSIDEELIKNQEIQKIIKRLNLVNKSHEGPTVQKLYDDLVKNPGDLALILKLADAHFGSNEFDKSFEILLENYPKHKEKIKSKLLSFFDVLGFEHEAATKYRKKLSSLLFS